MWYQATLVRKPWRTVIFKKIIFKKIGFKKIDFKGEIVILSALEALSKYFIITIRLLVIDIVNERNSK